MSVIALALALMAFWETFNRLRQINFRTTRFRYVAMYLGCAWFELGVLYDALAADVPLYAVIQLVAMVIWLYLITRDSWKQGIPMEARTGHGDLGPAEIESRP